MRILERTEGRDRNRSVNKCPPKHLFLNGVLGIVWTKVAELDSDFSVDTEFWKGENGPRERNGIFCIYTEMNVCKDRWKTE